MYRRMIVMVLGMVLILVLTASLSAQTDMPEVQHTMATISTHPSQGDVQMIEGGEAELFVTEDGITISFRTAGLEEGHVYTAWIVILNNPENCESSPCTATDILANTATNTEVTWGDAILVGPDQRMSFAGFLPAGEVPEGWYGNGIINPFEAEIHVVINDHGLLIPELALSMLNSYRGGCTDESLPAPFPDTAKADGEPGPNTCRLVQVAVFKQGQ